MLGQPACHTPAEGSSASGHHGVACGQLGKVLCGPSGCHWLPEDLQPADDLSESRGLRQASLTRTEGRQDAAPSSCRRRRRRPERGHPHELQREIRVLAPERPGHGSQQAAPRACRACGRRAGLIRAEQRHEGGFGGELPPGLEGLEERQRRDRGGGTTHSSAREG